MSEAIKIILKHEFNWMKRDFYFLCGMITLSALLCRFFSANNVIVLLVVIFLVVKSFMFMNAYSLLSGRGNSFSWKLLQGLPLSKVDLIKLVVASGMFANLPLLLVIVLFWSFISKELLSADYNVVHVAFNLVFVFTYFLICTVCGQIEYPRKEFQKKNATNTLLKSIGFYLIIFASLLYAAIFLGWIENNYGMQPFYYLIAAVKKITEVVSSWWSVPILIVANFHLYKCTLSLWVNEKRTYKPNDWNPKKEYSQITISLCLLVVGIYTTDLSTPDIYYGKVNTLVYNKKYLELEKALALEDNSKLTNIYGMNPMLVALNEGNLEMVKFLESKKLSFAGRITDKKNQYYGFDALMFSVNSGKKDVVEYLFSKNIKNNVLNDVSGFYPIHYASYRCKPQMVDVLIKNGADINVLNDKGQTPLIVASRAKCYPAVVTLTEAGAHFEIADKSGKTALDHLKGIKEKYADDLKYYIEKHSRMPASEAK